MITLKKVAYPELEPGDIILQGSNSDLFYMIVGDRTYLIGQEPHMPMVRLSNTSQYGLEEDIEFETVEKSLAYMPVPRYDMFLKVCRS